jgi:hypothetical protein
MMTVTAGGLGPGVTVGHWQALGTERFRGSDSDSEFDHDGRCGQVGAAGTPVTKCIFKKLFTQVQFGILSGQCAASSGVRDSGQQSSVHPSRTDFSDSS